MTTRSVPWAPGRLPGIGHAHRLLGDPLPLLRELPELGPVVRVGLGPSTLYMVTTPELLRSIGLGTAGRFHREDLIEPIAPFAGRLMNCGGPTIVDAMARLRTVRAQVAAR